MKYVKGLEAFTTSKRSAVTLGKFDGLHRGHQKLVNKINAYKDAAGVDRIVCAFDMAPLYERLKRPYQVLMTKQERGEHLEGKADYLIDCPFTEAFSEMEAEAFIRDILIGMFHAAYVVVGTDFHFGYKKRGDFQMLEAFQEQYGYHLDVIEKETYHGREISSTYVREALAEGKMELVEKLLGYPYTVEGVVEHGKQLGRTLGFPTFNVEPPREKLLPPRGVYLEQVKVDDRWYQAIGNVGVKPTVSNQKKTLIESYLFDYADTAYGKNVQIRLHAFRRPEQKFQDIPHMKEQVDRDLAYARDFFRHLK